jgi:hypothetical protein
MKRFGRELTYKRGIVTLFHGRIDSLPLDVKIDPEISVEYGQNAPQTEGELFQTFL